MSTDVDAVTAALSRLERTLVREGGILWRKSILEGEPAEVDWPADLPSLPAFLRAFFAWRSGGRGSDWRSAEWAEREYRSNAVEEKFSPSLVPVEGSSFVD